MAKVMSNQYNSLLFTLRSLCITCSCLNIQLQDSNESDSKMKSKAQLVGVITPTTLPHCHSLILPEPTSIINLAPISHCHPLIPSEPGEVTLHPYPTVIPQSLQNLLGSSTLHHYPHCHPLISPEPASIISPEPLLLLSFSISPEPTCVINPSCLPQLLPPYPRVINPAPLPPLSNPDPLRTY